MSSPYVSEMDSLGPRYSGSGDIGYWFVEFRGPGGEQSSNGLGPAPAVPAYGPGTEGAGTRVCGYAIKNSGLTVAVNRQHLHVCVKEPRVKIRISGVARTGLDGIGPYRNKWSRSQGTGWGARRVMARSMKPQCWNVTLHVSEPVVSLVP